MSFLVQAQRERVGRKIRTARLHCGLSHDQLASRIGTSRQHLIKLEKGQHLPRPEMLIAIARETGKSVGYFESEDEEDSDQVDIGQMIQRLLDRAVEAKVAAVLADRAVA